MQVLGSIRLATIVTAIRLGHVPYKQIHAGLSADDSVNEGAVLNDSMAAFSGGRTNGV